LQARRDAIVNCVVELSKKPKMPRTKPLIDFWNPKDKSGLVPISIKDHYGAWTDDRVVLGSRDFSLEMWQRKEASCPAQAQFIAFAKRCCPGYDALLAVRYPLKALLKDCGDNADYAFVAAVWLYSSIVPEKLYPCGFRSWPPPSSAAPNVSRSSAAASSSAQPGASSGSSSTAAPSGAVVPPAGASASAVHWPAGTPWFTKLWDVKHVGILSNILEFCQTSGALSNIFRMLLIFVKLWREFVKHLLNSVKQLSNK